MYQYMNLRVDLFSRSKNDKSKCVLSIPPLQKIKKNNGNEELGVGTEIL